MPDLVVRFKGSGIMLTFVIQAMEGIFTIIFIVGIGYVLSKKNWFDERSSSLIARLVTTVSLPFYMITSLTKNFTAERLTKMAPDMLLPIGSMLLALLIGKLAYSVFKVQKGRRGVFCTNYFIANTMFIGLPVNLALFGDQSIPSVMLYYIVNTIFFWTIGVHNIVADTEGQHASVISPSVLKKLLSPPLLGFFVALLLIMADIQLPRFLFNSFQYVGNLTTPMSLIFIGIEISRISLRSFNFEKDIIGGLFGRFIICPLCVLALVPFMTVSDMSIKVFTMQAAMPAMTQMAIVAKQYGVDSQYAAALSFITILFGLLVIPVYMTIVNICF